jgi:DNA invertase Pin-like site-specific DNA recombinase
MPDVGVRSRSRISDSESDSIERAAGARGNGIGTWYAERRSGRTMVRGELVRLREDARAGRVRRLYVFRLDRLTRSGIRDTFELVEELRANVSSS